MKHVIKHDLGLERARKAAVEAWEHYSPRFARNQPSLHMLDESKGVLRWKTSRGADLQCTIEIRERSVELEMEVPLLLRPLAKVAIMAVEKEVSGWIARYR